MRTTQYMRRVAARGNVRVEQVTLASAPVVRSDQADHVVRMVSTKTTRHLPFILCHSCAAALPMSEQTVFEACRIAACGNNASDCECCGRGFVEFEAEDLSRDQSWRRYGR